jgi:hypothetical protein
MNDINQQIEFYDISLSQGINDIVPCDFIKSVSTDKPWITASFKHLNARRSECFCRWQYGTV